MQIYPTLKVTSKMIYLFQIENQPQNANLANIESDK